MANRTPWCPSSCHYLPILVQYLSEWSDPLPSTGSDHMPTGILLRFEAPLFWDPPPIPQLGSDRLARPGLLLESYDYHASPPNANVPIAQRLVQDQSEQDKGSTRTPHPGEKDHVPVQTLVDRTIV